MVIWEVLYFEHYHYVLRVACYVLRVACYVLRVTCYVLRVAGYASDMQDLLIYFATRIYVKP